MAEDAVRLIEWFLRIVIVAMYRRFGFWGTVALLLGLAGVVWLSWGLARGVRLLAQRMTKVVSVGQPVPPFFGISYVDLTKKSWVCHVIPINLLVGVAQATKLMFKKGLDVKVGRKRV